MFSYQQRKFELEDSVIELHNEARYLETHTNQVEIAKKIRQMADDLSEKLKKEKHYEWYR